MAMDENNRIERVLHGDPAAFECLVRKYQARLVAFLWNLLGSGDDARDAAQETFIRAYANLGRFDRSLDRMLERLKAGKEVWIMFVDVHVLDYDGNLFDAANIGANAAFKTAVVPASRHGKGEDYPLPVLHQPISLTAVKIDGKILVDPTHDEERVADARLTVTTTETGNLCAMQKGLVGSFSIEEVFKVIEMSRRLGAETRLRLPG